MQRHNSIPTAQVSSEHNSADNGSTPLNPSENGVASKVQTQDGVRILPIPPPLEFPYPAKPQRTQNSYFGTANIEEQAGQHHGGGHSDPGEGQTPGLLQTATEPIKRPSGPSKRHQTERPQQLQRPSILGARRRQTQVPPSIYNPGLWDSESESSDSSDDEESAPSQQLNKPKSRTLRDRLRNTAPASDLAGKKGSSDPYSRFAVGNDEYKTQGHVSKNDGRLKISLKEIGARGYLAKALGATLKQRTGKENEGEVEPLSHREERSAPTRHLSGTTAADTPKDVSPGPRTKIPVPTLNIVIMVIGSRGDIQPFLRLGKILKEEHGHRVRIATHPAFKEFIEKDSSLEFFSVGGDPAELMAFMVKNPGLIPKTETIRSGEIGKRREAMFEMFKGFWRACINTTDDETDIANIRMMGERHPFVADAIIANPPSFAHIHCAERLGIPLHLMFTFPTSPTQQFPHPLANIKQSNVEANYTNFMSYPLVDMMTWQGLGDLVNRFRVKSLGLEPISTLWAPGQLFRMRVPHTYLWSPGLIPKPADWGPEINIAGFVFLDLASSFEPPKELQKFLDSGPPPIYIGFGSIVVDDPARFTSLIFDAIKQSGVRALVSEGWGGLGGDSDVPENIFMLGNTPHDWLFPRVSAVVHHGGAGTTAIGLKCGRPTMIVPFFGDQPFWGAMVHKAGAGAEPVPYKKLTADKLAESIKFLLRRETQEAAKTMAEKIEEEGDGAQNAIKYFHETLPLTGNHSIRCSIFKEEVAVWWLKNTHVRLSVLAAEMLIRQNKIQWRDLRLVRHYDWNDFEGPGEPFTGTGAAIAGTVGSIVQGIGRTPFRWAKTVKGKPRKSQDGPVCPKSGSRPSSKKDADTAAEENPNLARLALREANKTKLSTEPEPITRTIKSSNSPLNGLFEETMAQELAHDTGSGLAKTGAAIARAPMDVSLALARGFHNAPRLYGDSTVRTPRRVTGIKSGLQAAGEEFRYGVYDGWSGLFRQPYQGAKEDGPLGLATGVGKGIGGLVLKNIAAGSSLPAYTMKGIHMELTKGRQPTRFLRRARILAGQKQLALLNKDELAAADERIREAWKVILALQREIHIAKDKGVRGRIAIYKGKRKWKKYGIFESTEQTKRALEAYQHGRDLELDFVPLHRPSKQHNVPRDHLVDKDKIERKRERDSLDGRRSVDSKRQSSDQKRTSAERGRPGAGQREEPIAEVPSSA